MLKLAARILVFFFIAENFTYCNSVFSNKTDTTKTINLAEIIVSANRQAGLRSEAPMAIAKLSSKQIAETRANLMTELLNKIPGVVLANFNHEQSTIAIRQPIGLNPYFLFLEDGIPIRPMGVYQNNGLIEINMGAIDNIEVIKGPNSSLYGPEAAGGLVNFLTKKASEKFEMGVGFQKDAFGYYQSRLNASGMLTKNWGLVINGMYAKQKDGWQASSDYFKLGINVRTDIKINEKLSLTGVYTTNQYDAQAGGSVDSTTFKSRNYISQAPFAYRRIDAKRARISLEKQWNTNNSTTFHLFARQNAIGQFPAYSIRRITGNPNNSHGEVNENSFKSIGAIIQNSNQIQWKNTQLITGLSIDYAPNDYWAYYVRLNRNKDNGVHSVNRERPDSILVNYNAKILNAAIYGQLNISITAKLKMVAGGRLDKMNYDFDNNLKPTAFSGAPDEKNGYFRFSPKLGFTFQIAKNNGLYANAAQGFSPPNISQLYRGVKVPVLKAAIFNNSEIGGWATFFENKIKLDWAAYYMIGKNEVVRFVNADNSVENKSAGKTKHFGLEYSITYNPNNSLTLRFVGSNARHLYDEFSLSAKQVFDGNEMPISPHFTGNAEITYKPNWLKGLRIGLEWQRVSSFFKDNENKTKYEDNTFFGLKGLSILHVRAGYKYKKAEIFMNILNATDELYTTYVSRGNFGNSFYPTAPRNVVIGVSFGL